MTGGGVLSASVVEAIDPGGMFADVLDTGAQLADAVWRFESAGVPCEDAPGGLAVCGMGGSASGGDLAAAVVGSRARRRMRTLRSYDLDPWAGGEALVLCASYSGETEETLACYEAAGRVGAPRVALTTGGSLAAAARRDGVPVIGVPSGMQPRAAVAYMTVSVLECAAACGAAPSLRDEIDATSRLLGELAAEWGPRASEDAEPKELARRLEGHLPVIYGAGRSAAVARRWKTQINENAELPAFWSELPDANHNEICGYRGSLGLAALHAVFLEDSTWSGPIARRVEATADLLPELGAAGVERVRPRGHSAMERVMSLVMLGDLVSAYLAVLRGVDPTPVDAIERFKEDLSRRAAADQP